VRIRLHLKCDVTRAETIFRLSAKRTSPFKSAGGRQFSRLLVAEVCASAVVMLDTPCSEVVWRVLATHCIRQFPLHFPSRASPCAITFQLDSNTVHLTSSHLYRSRYSINWSPTQKCFETLRLSTTHSTCRYDAIPKRQVGPCKTRSVSTSGFTPPHDLSTVSTTSQHTQRLSEWVCSFTSFKRKCSSSMEGIKARLCEWAGKVPDIYEPSH